MKTQRTKIQIQKVFVSIIVIATIVLTSGCLNEKAHNNTSEDNKKNTVIEATEKIVDNRYYVNATELKRNAEVPFKVGQQFVYKKTPATGEYGTFGEDIFTVEGIEKNR